MKNKYLCSSCKKRPIKTLKSTLCSYCSVLAKRKSFHEPYLAPLEIPRQKREFQFIKAYFTHDDWTYHPVRLTLITGLKYSPDFYDRKRDVFIEVAGTRQAYELNKHKYALLKESYPCFNFEIRYADGDLLRTTLCGRAKWNKHQPSIGLSNLLKYNPYQTNKTRGVNNKRAKLTDQKVIAIREDKRTYKEIAKSYGVCPMTIWKAKNGERWRHVDG